MYTPRDLAARLLSIGLEVPEEGFDSAMATARFLEDQRPNGLAFVVGETGLTTALHANGYTLTDRNPDYVVLARPGRTVRAHIARDPLGFWRRSIHRHEP